MDSGGGEEHDALVRLIEQLELTDHVRFLGIQNNIPDWLNAADVFVLSSAWEGFGLVVAEAMACEKTVVATDAGGVKEVLRDCGILVPTQDPQALSFALQKALLMPASEVAVLGARARARVVTQFSIEATVDTWVNVYGSR